MGQKPGHSGPVFLCSASSEAEIKVSAGLSSYLGGLGKDVLQLVQVIGRFTAYGWKTEVPLSSLLSAGDSCQHLSAAHGPCNLVPTLLKANSGECP